MHASEWTNKLLKGNNISKLFRLEVELYITNAILYFFLATSLLVSGICLMRKLRGEYQLFYVRTKGTLKAVVLLLSIPLYVRTVIDFPVAYYLKDSYYSSSTSNTIFAPAVDITLYIFSDGIPIIT